MSLAEALKTVDGAYMTDIRRALHMHPELGFELPETTALVKRELTRFGISYTEEYCDGSVVAVVNPSCPGPALAIRADMDALPVKEETGLSYASKISGRMHACGHDAHTAILLGTAAALAGVRNALPQRIKLIFQPSEEGMDSGAKRLVANGVLDDVREIIALHVTNAIPTGKMGFAPGPFMASNDAFIIELSGRSGHAAEPHTAVDALALGVRVYSELQFLMTREVSPLERCTLNIGSMQAGHTNNVVPDFCRMLCTLRTYNEKTAAQVLARMETIVKNRAAEAGGVGKVIYNKHLPPVINDEELNTRLRGAAARQIGEENVLHIDLPGLGAEDFAMYQTRVPGVFFRIGTGNTDKGCTAALHHSHFNLDEDALSIGAQVFARFAFEGLGGRK